MPAKATRVFPGAPAGLRLGISGAGAFATDFIPLFTAHPGVAELSLAEIDPVRRAAVAARFGIRRTFASHEEMLESDLDAVAIMTQRHLHGPQALAALRAGKQVWCAVPIGVSVEEIAAIIGEATARRSVYMSAETSYYYPDVLYCRAHFAAGDFGDFVYGEGNYLHDMSQGFYEAFQRSGGPDWRRVAGVPPMLYASHSTASVLSVTGAHAIDVSALGWNDRADDGVYGVGRNLWDNPFSNESALLRTSDGGILRLNEFRRVGWSGRISELPLSIYGTRGVFNEDSEGQFWTDLQGDNHDLGAELAFPYQVGYTPTTRPLDEAGAAARYAPIQPWRRLPPALWSQRNMHLGSHQFLVDDFVRAATSGCLPPLHAWAAARYTVPGIVAHASALRGGERLSIPDLGEPPDDWPRLDHE